MERFEFSTESFLVKVQVTEATQEAGGFRLWRGVMTHIASGRQFNFESLEEIESLVIPYLEALGVQFRDRGDGNGA